MVNEFVQLVDMHFCICRLICFDNRSLVELFAIKELWSMARALKAVASRWSSSPPC